jgi:hypothetical protein
VLGRRLSIYFFVNQLQFASTTPECGHYEAVGGALYSTWGVLKAVTDARQFCKWICQHPRHPDCETPVPPALRRMMSDSGVSSLLSKAHKFVGEQPAEAEPNTGVAKSYEAMMAALRPAIPDMPEHTLDFVGKVFVARGVFKALCIGDYLKEYQASLDATQVQIRAVLPKIELMTPTAAAADASPDALQTRQHCAQHDIALRGALSVLTEISVWVCEILAATQSSKKLFAAGDSNAGKAEHATIFAPASCALLSAFGEFRAVATKYQVVMQREVADEGWPPPSRRRRWPDNAILGKHRCQQCSVQFAKVWVSQGVCCHCETSRRQEVSCEPRAVRIWEHTGVVSNKRSVLLAGPLPILCVRQHVVLWP